MSKGNWDKPIWRGKLRSFPFAKHGYKPIARGPYNGGGTGF